MNGGAVMFAKIFKNCDEMPRSCGIPPFFFTLLEEGMYTNNRVGFPTFPVSYSMRSTYAYVNFFQLFLYTYIHKYLHAFIDLNVTNNIFQYRALANIVTKLFKIINIFSIKKILKK